MERSSESLYLPGALRRAKRGTVDGAAHVAATIVVVFGLTTGTLVVAATLMRSL